jgi:putative endonuclease
MSRVSGKAYYVYVLWSPLAERFYIGISEDPQARLEQHNQSGRGWTSRYAPWRLVFSEGHGDYRGARKRELQLKAQKGGEGFWRETGLDATRFGRGPLGS